MSLSRLIHPRSSLRINRFGFPKPVRWLSSQPSDGEIEKPSQLRKAGVPREQRAVAAEMFVKKYMEANSGVFPKVTHIHNEVGGSWYTVKSIFKNIKEKIIGTQLENHKINDSSTPVKDTGVPTVTTTHSVPDSGIELHSCDDSAVHAADQTLQCQDKGQNIGHTIETAEGEHSSGLAADPSPSHSTNILSYCSSETQTSPVVQCTEPRSEIHVSETESHDKLISSRCLDQQENKTTHRLSPESSVEMSTNSAIFSSSQNVKRLSKNFKLSDDAAVSEAKNGNMQPEEALSDIVLSLRKDKNSQGKSLLSTGISQPPGKEMVSLTQNIMSNMAEPFTGPKKLMGLEDTEGMNNQVFPNAGRGFENRDVSTHSFFQCLEEPMQKDESKRAEIKGLMDCIKGLPGGLSIRPKDDESGKRSQLGIHSKAALRSFNAKEGSMPSECHALQMKSNHDDLLKKQSICLSTRADKASTPDFTKAIEPSQLSVLTCKEKPNEMQQKIAITREADENKAVVKFLHRAATESNIVHAFESCGEVLKVEISSPEGAFYRNADVIFKTKEGLQNALLRHDIVIKMINVTVEAAATGENNSSGISIPNLVGDPDVPAALVKNPTRTVKITQLTSDISSHDVLAAFESRGNNITGFFYGKLASVAYVEFEEEDDKEVALAEYSIDVLGKQLLLSRIDAPRTTVLRVSLRHHEEYNKVIKVCASLGKAITSHQTSSGSLDVQYRITEWPNMLNILNRLNAAQVNGHKVQAKPASVIPPRILRILWHQPEEREYVRNVVRKLLQKLGKNIVHEADITDFLNFY